MIEPYQARRFVQDYLDERAKPEEFWHKYFLQKINESITLAAKNGKHGIDFIPSEKPWDKEMLVWWTKPRYEINVILVDLGYRTYDGSRNLGELKIRW